MTDPGVPPGGRRIVRDRADEVLEFLEIRHPGRFAVAPGMAGRAPVSVIMLPGRPGWAHVYRSPAPDGGTLLTFADADGPENNEARYGTNPAELVDFIEAWAFPPAWTPPPPLDPAAERRRLAALAGGLALRGEVVCRILDPLPDLERLLTPAGRAALAADLATLSLTRVAANFPADPLGRLALKATVLLNAYETTTPPAKDRAVCLAVEGPARRRDVAAVRVGLAALILANQSHRWDDHPWLWQEVPAPATHLLGVAPRPGDRDGDAATAAACLDDLGRGAIEAGLARFGLTLDVTLRRILGGERTGRVARCAIPDAAWTDLLVATIRRSAPWALPGAARAEADRIARWAGAKKGRPRREPLLKLVIFPGQHHSMKACLTLTADLDGANPRLTVDITARNDRLAETIWARPVAVDLIRHGLIMAEVTPPPGAAPAGAG